MDQIRVARRARSRAFDPGATWLAEEVCPVKLVPERRTEALPVRCRTERVEPPGPTRIERLVGSARATFEARFCERTVVRLGC